MTAVQAEILNRLGEEFGLDSPRAGEIGDGGGNFEESVMCAR